MGASASGIEAAEQPAAESLLTAFKTLSAAERRRHASVLNYWLSVRGDKEFPPLHDLDPLELSDAGPSSILLELISGGHDAEIRHLGEALREEAWPERIIDAPNPSVLSCIAKKLPIVAISRDFLAFEDEYETASGTICCSVTLLPLSAGGAWVDYVYAFVSVDEVAAQPKCEQEEEPGEDLEGREHRSEAEQSSQGEAFDTPDESAWEQHTPTEAVSEQALESKEVPGVEEPFSEESAATESADRSQSPVPKATPGFTKLLDSLAGLTGFYGSQPVKIEPALDHESSVEDSLDAEEEQELVAETPDDSERASAEQAESPPTELPIEDERSAEAPSQANSLSSEGILQNKLSEVRAKADEARMARLRADAALYEGLGAAYDFALDAEEAPEEYLRLVEAQGLKIQLRSPMKPVVKLAFSDTCDELTIKQLEAVLAWAFEEELARGTLAERIAAAGGIGSILNLNAKAA